MLGKEMPAAKAVKVLEENKDLSIRGIFKDDLLKEALKVTLKLWGFEQEINQANLKELKEALEAVPDNNEKGLIGMVLKGSAVISAIDAQIKNLESSEVGKDIMREKELSDKAEILDELKKSLEEDAGIGSLNYARKLAELRGRYSPSMVEELAGGVLGADEADKRIVVINKKLEELKKNINDTSRHQLERLSATRQLLQSANKEYVREYLSGQNQMNWWKWWVVESFRTKTQERLAKKELEEKIAVIERDLSVVNALENNHINKLEELLPAEQDPLIKGVLEGLRAKLGKFGKEAYQETRKVENIEISLTYVSDYKPNENKAALEALSVYYKTELKEVSAKISYIFLSMPCSHFYGWDFLIREKQS